MELRSFEIPDLTRLALECRQDVDGLEVVWNARHLRSGIAFTFDDGPDPDGTERVLDVLDRNRVTATFFLVAERAERYPELVKKTIASGHRIGLHSDKHEPLDRLQTDILVRRLGAARRVIEDVAEVEVGDFRPPYGRISAPLARALEQLRLRLIMWSHDVRDWERMQQAELLRRLDSSIRPGALLLLHDGSDGFPGQGRATARALEQILPLLSERRLKAVTTEEL